MPRLVLNVRQQHVLCRFHRKAGNLFQFLELLIVQGSDFRLRRLQFRFALRKGQLALFQCVGLFVKNLFPLEDAPFVALDFRAAFPVFALRIGTDSKYFFFCFRIFSFLISSALRCASS